MVTSNLVIQEKRYRSMQEHIRRAHPEHYISKLPATEESFQLMINTPPSERPPPPTSSNLAPHGLHNSHNICEYANDDEGYGNDRHSYYGEDSSTPNTPRNLDEYTSSAMLPAASAAAALAQLHNHKLEPDWESENDWMSDTEAHKQAMRSSIELPPLMGNNIEPTSDPFSHLNPRRRELLPSILSTSPPGRSSTLPPIQRNPSTNRPRKQSVSKRAREPQHKRQKSRGENAHLRRMSYDRKAYSAEPSSGLSAAYGKRWEDLIDAATSATEDVDEDRTPVGAQSPSSYQSNQYRSLHHPSQSTAPPYHLSPHPTFKVIKLHLFNKHSPHHPIFPTHQNLSLLSKVVKVARFSTSNLVVFPTLHQASHLKVSKSTALHAKASRTLENHTPVQNVFVESVKRV
ncbi:hypothetical protein EG329_010600 [Mollisiaceae sp. DMI_Dod_QoI]|nr:hypothetical protein EG329_010600 [Helotiales sp. DMI_Dod_QoI]